MQDYEIIGIHSFHFNKDSNGGEAILFTTKFMKSNSMFKENSVIINQEFSLNSYGNSSSISLYANPITPAMLRQLADELENAEKEARNSI